MAKKKVEQNEETDWFEGDDFEKEDEDCVIRCQVTGKKERSVLSELNRSELKSWQMDEIFF